MGNVSYLKEPEMGKVLLEIHQSQKRSEPDVLVVYTSRVMVQLILSFKAHINMLRKAFYDTENSISH